MIAMKCFWEYKLQHFGVLKRTKSQVSKEETLSHYELVALIQYRL